MKEAPGLPQFEHTQIPALQWFSQKVKSCCGGTFADVTQGGDLHTGPVVPTKTWKLQAG